MPETGNAEDLLPEVIASNDSELRQSNLYRQMQDLLADGYTIAARSLVRAEMARIAKIAFLAFADARRK